MNVRMWGVFAGTIMAVVLLLGTASAAPGGKAKSDNPHGRKDAKACLVCHVTHPAEGKRDASLRLSGDVVKLCGGCHEKYQHMHPVRIAVPPDMKSPEDLPLGKDGTITCITCHDVMEGNGIPRKRRVVGRALCLNCHVDSDILAQIVWYPTRLKAGELGRLEFKVVEFRINKKKAPLGESVLLYYYARNVDTNQISFGTNILYDDGSHGDNRAKDGIYTMTEHAPTIAKKERKVYTGWVVDTGGRRSNTVTLAVEYE